MWGGASAAPTLENGVLHVNYQQVQVTSAILVVGLSFADRNKKTITNTKGRGCGTFIGDGISVKKVWNDENDVDGLRPASATAELCYANEAGETPQALKDSQVQKGPAAGPFVYAFRPVAKLWAFRNSPETWLGHTST